MTDHDVTILRGKTLTAINYQDERLTLTCSDGKAYVMYHRQECCEQVVLVDGLDDLKALIGDPLMLVEEETNSEEPKPSHYVESFTWTFYKFATIKGRATLRWLGESTGYYSERVDFAEVPNAY